MPITYSKLFSLLNKKKISKTTLQKQVGMSSTTMAKLSKDEKVSLSIIEEICKALQCQPGDIMEIVEVEEHPLLKTLREEQEMKLKGGLYHLTQIKLSYNSNRIEGSKLSEEQTRYIYETNTIAMSTEEATPIDDIIETLNHFNSFDIMLKVANQRLTEDIIKEFHKMIKSNTSDSKKEWFMIGEYKQKPNMVGDKRTVPPSKVRGEMAKLLTNYEEIDKVSFEDIIDFHYKFESIHPFQDGNGRVGRLIMFKECLRHGIMPFIINESHKLFYYRGLKEYEFEKGYLIDTCYSAQDEYSKQVEYFIDNT